MLRHLGSAKCRRNQKAQAEESALQVKQALGAWDKNEGCEEASEKG